MSRTIGNFQQIYLNILGNRQPGATDEEILQEAQSQFRATYDTDFPHLAAWNVVKNSPQYRVI